MTVILQLIYVSLFLGVLLITFKLTSDYNKYKENLNTTATIKVESMSELDRPNLERIIKKLNSYGIQETCLDIKMYTKKSVDLPNQMKDLLSASKYHGSTRGVEIVQFIENKRDLLTNEAIYAVSVLNVNKEFLIYTFIDKVE